MVADAVDERRGREVGEGKERGHGRRVAPLGRGILMAAALVASGGQLASEDKAGDAPDGWPAREGGVAGG